MKKETKIGVVLIFVLFVIASFVFYKIIFFESNLSVVEVNFFDVGEGDSILIEMPKSNQILIDGGPSRNVVEKIAKEMPLLDNKIEMVVLSHPDKDHITGLFEIFDTFEVERVLMPKIEGELASKNLYLNFKRRLKEEGSEVIFAKQGQKISFPGEVYFFIFWPKENFSSKETNNFSVVGKLIFGKISFLFTGDIPEKIEKELVRENFNLQSSVLKIAHHGSKHSSSEEFLNFVKPLLAVISVGKNNYGHPSNEVLERLEKYDIKTARTDGEGDIKIITDGEGLKLNKNFFFIKK